MKIKALIFALALSSFAFGQKLSVSYLYTFGQTPIGGMVNYQFPKSKFGIFVDYTSKQPKIENVKTVSQKDYEYFLNPDENSFLKNTAAGNYWYNMLNVGVSCEVVKGLSLQIGGGGYTYKDYAEVSRSATLKYRRAHEKKTVFNLSPAISYTFKGIRLTAGYNSAPNTIFAGIGYMFKLPAKTSL